MLALVAFAMVMAGTFLVRSGILSSVHAFAVDPERGAFILGLLLIYVVGALALFALRIGVVRDGKTFTLFSREVGVVGYHILLSAHSRDRIGRNALAARSRGDGRPYFGRAALFQPDDRADRSCADGLVDNRPDAALARG